MFTKMGGVLTLTDAEPLPPSTSRIHSSTMPVARLSTDCKAFCISGFSSSDG
jgi:hypothetical protein